LQRRSINWRRFAGRVLRILGLIGLSQNRLASVLASRRDALRLPPEAADQRDTALRLALLGTAQPLIGLQSHYDLDVAADNWATVSGGSAGALSVV
jgi:hypothetical protein